MRFNFVKNIYDFFSNFILLSNNELGNDMERRPLFRERYMNYSEDGAQELADLLGDSNDRDQLETQSVEKYRGRFLDGVDLVANKVWPITFAGLLAHDIICYIAHPKDRYGNQFWKILIGLSPNQLSVANHLGSEVFGGMYWLGAPIIFTAPLLAGLIAIFIKPQPLVVSLEAIPVNRYQDLITVISPWSRLRQTLAQAEQESAVQALIDFISTHGAFSYYYGLSALARVTKRMSKADDLYQQAMIFLQNTSSYYAWQAGVSQNFWEHLWIIPKSLPILFIYYSQLYFLGVVIQKIIGTVNYFLAKNRCEKSGKFFSYQDASEAYECTDCGNWSFISYADMFEAQRCLDSLLAQKNISPQKIASYLSQWKDVRNIDQFDLSGQSWRDWSDNELDNILTVAERILPKQTVSLDISTNTWHTVSVAQNLLQRLAKFIQVIQPKQLLAFNQGLDGNAICTLLPSTQNGTVTYLDVSNNPISDVGANCLANFTMQNPIETLLLPNANITTSGIQTLILANNRVSNLDLSGNLLSTATWDVLSKKRSIRSLNLSDMPIAATDLQQFCQNAARGFLQSLTLNNILNFDDGHAHALTSCMPNLHTLNLRHNPDLSDIGTSVLLHGAQNGTLFKIDLAYCGIETFVDVLGVLPSTVNEIDISANPASVQQYQLALLILSQKNITTLTLSDKFCGDAIGLTFAQVFSQRNFSLAVNFSNTGITAVGAEAVLTVSTLRAVDLSNNYLTGIGTALSSLLVKNHLMRLNLGNAQLSTVDLQALIQILPHTNLIDLTLKQNVINGEMSVSLAKQLIASSTPHVQQLGVSALQSTINRDIIRGFRAAKQQGHLEVLDLSHSDLAASAELAFCRLSRLGMHFNFAHYPSNPAINFHNCQIISSSLPQVGANVEEIIPSNGGVSPKVSGWVEKNVGFGFSLLKKKISPLESITYIEPVSSTQSVPLAPLSRVDFLGERTSFFSSHLSNENVNSRAMGFTVWPSLLFAIPIVFAFILVCYLSHKTYRWFYAELAETSETKTTEKHFAELTYSRGASA